MKDMVPEELFLTKGVGKHPDRLSSFELALRDAGIEKCNLVYVSSIAPPGCKMIPKEEGLKKLQAGRIIFVVMSRNSCNEPHRLISSSVGIALPSDQSCYGYLSEYHTSGQTGEEAGDYAEDLAASMLASTLGIDFNVDQSWDEKEELFKVSGKIFKTTNLTQSAICEKGTKNQKVWTTVLAAAVLL